uniref:alkaline phosphatase n=1 Tax=Megaselia scalaris TaxID=36166 RepID=T1GX53_MEGSC
MTINGRSDRGTDILGLTDGNNYEVLTWANGPGFYDHRLEGTNSGKSFANTWKAVAERTDRNNLVYRHLSAIPSKISTHSGEDVPVYATGPGSSLVRGVFEQNYIGHVMSYVGCMGPSQNIDDSCEMQKRSGSSI